MRTGSTAIRVAIVLAALSITAMAPDGGTQGPNPPEDSTDRLVDWSQFHFDPQQSGFNRYEDTLGPTNVQDLIPLWRGRTTDYNSYFSPIVSGGVVYVATYNPSHLHAFPGRCRAAPLGQCRPLWTTDLPDGADTTPAAGEGNVYLGTNTYELQAFDAADGHPVWSAHIGSQMVGAPVVDRGVVYVAPSDGAVRAFDAGTGEELWTTDTGPRGFSEDNTLAMADGSVFVTSDATYALDARTGAMIWRNRSAAFGGTPAVVDGVVYAGGRKLYALDSETGLTLWSAPVRFAVTTSPAVADGVVYVNGSDGLMYAINAGDGSRLWTVRIGAGALNTSPVIANGVVYTYSNTTRVFAFATDCGLEGATCSPLWSADVGLFGPYASPAVVNGTLYLVNGSGFDCCATLFTFGLP